MFKKRELSSTECIALEVEKFNITDIIYLQNPSYEWP